MYDSQVFDVTAELVHFLELNRPKIDAVGIILVFFVSSSARFQFCVKI